MADIIITTGPDANSYITFDEANAILLTCAASFMEIGDQLTQMDAAYLVEAARDLDSLWSWKGIPTTNDQPMLWPRQYVTKPGFEMPGEPGWSMPWNDGYALQFKWDYLTPGRSAIPFLDDTLIPKQIKEAQALIAMLRKNGSNLVGDSQGDTQGLQLDVGFKIAYANAVRMGGDIHKRVADLGLFIGDGILRTPNA